MNDYQRNILEEANRQKDREAKIEAYKDTLRTILARAAETLKAEGIEVQKHPDWDTYYVGPDKKITAKLTIVSGYNFRTSASDWRIEVKGDYTVRSVGARTVLFTKPDVTKVVEKLRAYHVIAQEYAAQLARLETSQKSEADKRSARLAPLYTALKPFRTERKAEWGGTVVFEEVEVTAGSVGPINLEFKKLTDAEAMLLVETLTASRKVGA